MRFLPVIAGSLSIGQGMSEQLQTAPFSLRDYRIVALSVLGGALEVYDFIIFVFLSVTIADVFFPPSVPEWLRLVQSLVIFSVGYLARPLGGIVIAHFADKFGRKHMFNFTVLFMAMPCLLIGVLPGYATIGIWAPLLLLLARIVQGAALGGEVPNAWVFVAEHSPKPHRGYALGLLQAGLTLGYMLAALTATLLSRNVSDAELQQWAWRIPFIIGGIFGFISVWLRQWLSETPVFIALQQQQQLLQKLPLSAVFRRHKYAALPAALLTAMLVSAVVMTVVVTPIALQKFYGMDAATTFEISCIAILFLNVGCVIAGKLADLFGRWQTVALYSVLLAVGTSVLTLVLDAPPKTLLLGYAIAGLCSGIISAVPAIVVQLFPSAVKVTGISLVYNLTYSVCSSIMPLALLALLHAHRWGMAVFAWGMMLLGLATAYLFRHVRCYSD
jgi:MFS family permease